MTIKIIIILFILLAPVASIGDTKSISNHTENKSILLNNWKYRYGDSPINNEKKFIWINENSKQKWKNAETLINPEGRKNSQYLWFKTRLPGKNYKNPSIFMPRYIIKSYEVYLENEMIFKHINQFNDDGNSFKYFSWKIIYLPENYKGKNLFVRIYSDLINIGINEYVFIGSERHHFEYMIKKDIPFLILSLILIILSWATLILFFLNLKNIMNIGFSLLSFTISLTFISFSNLQQLLIENLAIWSHWTFFIPIGITIGMALFIKDIIDKKSKKILQITIYSILSISVLSIIMILFEIIPFIYGAIPGVIIYFIFLPIATLLIIKEYKQKKKNSRLLLLSNSSLIIYFIMLMLIMVFCIGTSHREILILIIIFFIAPLIVILIKEYLNTYNNLNLLSQELSIARSIQQSIISDTNPDIKNINISSVYIPMLAIGGDFYDFYEIRNKGLGIFIADVSGHGVPAALFSSMIKTAFSMQKEFATDPKGLMNNIAEIIKNQMGHNFLTACYVFVDLNEKKVYTSNAGHLPLFIFKNKSKIIKEIKPDGILISKLGNIEFDVLNEKIESGDKIILITDGIIECLNDKNEPLNIDGFKKIIKSNEYLHPEELTKKIITYLTSWNANGKNFEDDVTMIIAEIT